MKKLFLLALACCLSSQVHASITISGGATSPTIYEGPVTFPQLGFTGDGTITTWSTGSGQFTVSYSAEDLDFSPEYGSGFRLSQTITNNTGHAWKAFHINFVDTSGTASGAGNFLKESVDATTSVPGFASIVGNEITLLPSSVAVTHWPRVM